MLHELKIKSHEDTEFADVYVDGEKIDNVAGVEFEQFPGEHPTAVLHLKSFLDINTFSDVMYIADEEGVYMAVKYLKESIEKDEALKDEFKSRILSAFDELRSSFNDEKLAEKVLDVIFGE